MPLPIPTTPQRVDFLDGLVTLGGVGDPSTGGPGYAVHLYAANADMADRCFQDHDGDVLVLSLDSQFFKYLREPGTGK